MDQRQNSSFERNSEDEVNKSKITLLEAILPSIQHDIKTKGAETEKMTFKSNTPDNYKELSFKMTFRY